MTTWIMGRRRLLHVLSRLRTTSALSETSRQLLSLVMRSRAMIATASLVRRLVLKRHRRTSRLVPRRRRQFILSRHSMFRALLLGLHGDREMSPSLSPTTAGKMHLQIGYHA